MVNNEMELIMECNLNGHRDDGRGTCAECGEFIDSPTDYDHGSITDPLMRTDIMLSMRINGLENRLRALEAALQSIGKKGD